MGAISAPGTSEPFVNIVGREEQFEPYAYWDVPKYRSPQINCLVWEFYSAEEFGCTRPWAAQGHSREARNDFLITRLDQVSREHVVFLCNHSLTPSHLHSEGGLG